MLFAKRPLLSHLRVIGCLRYAAVVPKSDKFSERAAPAILMGYSELQKGYLLLNIHTRKFFVSRDVIFKEEIFHLEQTQTDSHSSMLMGSPSEQTAEAHVHDVEVELHPQASSPETIHDDDFLCQEQYHHRSKGYSQQEGLDYQDTFSLVAKMVTVRCVAELAVSKGWSLFQMDVYSSFLQGDLDEEMYMELPEGFKQPGETKVCKLLKSLYGLKARF